MSLVSRVLLVEDDEDLASVLGELLADAGAGTVSARSLRDVQLRRADALDCDVAVVDINLGADEPSGVDVHRWLRDQGFAGRTVFLTGHAQSHPLVVAAARTAGTSILAKPVRAEQLLQLTVGNSR